MKNDLYKDKLVLFVTVDEDRREDIKDILKEIIEERVRNNLGKNNNGACDNE